MQLFLGKFLPILLHKLSEHYLMNDIEFYLFLHLDWSSIEVYRGSCSRNGQQVHCVFSPPSGVPSYSPEAGDIKAKTHLYCW